MNVKYFADTDTLYIELYPAEVDETRDLDEDTLLELDTAGRLCALTIRTRERPHGDSGVLLRADSGRPGLSDGGAASLNQGRAVVLAAHWIPAFAGMTGEVPE